MSRAAAAAAAAAFVPAVEYEDVEIVSNELQMVTVAGETPPWPRAAGSAWGV